jgi:glucokinase
MPLYVGIDLGGTNIKAGVVDETGRVLSSASVPTLADRGPDAVILTMAQLARDVAAQAGATIEKIAAIGVGTPGMIDFDHGIVLSAPNLKGWRDIPLVAALSKITGRLVVIENDANAAAMGECWLGAGKGGNVRELVMLTLGTGVGGGFVVDGKVVHGKFGMAAELGHLVLIMDGEPCPCGQLGCLERYCSASAVGIWATRAVESGQASSLASLRSKGQEITSKDVFDAAAAGDALAKQLVDTLAAQLATACVTLCRLFDPELVVIGGGMIAAGEALLSPIRREFTKRSWSAVKVRTKIVPAVLGSDAGFIGSAAVALHADRAAHTVA